MNCALQFPVHSGLTTLVFGATLMFFAASATIYNYICSSAFVSVAVAAVSGCCCCCYFLLPVLRSHKKKQIHTQTHKPIHFNGTTSRALALSALAYCVGCTVRFAFVVFANASTAAAAAASAALATATSAVAVKVKASDSASI